MKIVLKEYIEQASIIIPYRDKRGIIKACSIQKEKS